MAISILHQDCDFLQDPYTFTKNYTQYCCDKCYGAFKTMKFKFPRKPHKIDSLLQETNNNVYSKADLQNVELLLKQKINNATSTAETPNSITFTSALCQLIKKYKYCKSDAETDTDPPVIGAIKESLRSQLTSIASKLLSSQHTKLEDLSVEEQNLWKQFDNSDIYEFITGKQDTLPEFQYNWIEPCQPAVHLPPGVLLAAHQTPKHQRAQPAQPVAQAAPPAQLAQAAPPAQPMPPAQLALHQNQRVAQFQQVQDQAPVAGPSGLQQPVPQHDLRPNQDLNDKELHTGIKQRCRKHCRQAKAIVTKLAHFCPNILLQVHLLKTRRTQGHHLNLRNSLVLFSSTFHFTNQETDTYQFYLFTTAQTSITFPAYGKRCGLHLHQPRQNPVQLLSTPSTTDKNVRANGSLHSGPRPFQLQTGPI